LAYTDMPTACAQFACLFAFYLWLKQASLLRMLFLGAMAGLALSAKLTSGPFLLSACAAMVIVQFWFCQDALQRIRKGVPQLAAAFALALLVLWGFYSFSTGHIQQALNIDAPFSLTNVPGPARSPIAQLVRINPVIPAPELVRGISLILSMNKAAPECYLLGRSKPGGWWYFFPVALALKSPIPFMLLAFVGFLRSVAQAPKRGPSALMPGAAIVAIFVATMFVSLRVGTRHVLVVLPLLAVLAGYGASFLWRVPGFKPIWGRAVLGVLLAWQMISSMQAQSDFLAYFNEFAPSDPSVALVKGCDLDCGQDLLRLSHELRSLHASHVNIGVWSSTDLSHLDLPPFDILQGDQPATGWVAVSVRALRTGQVVACKDGRMFPTNANPPGMLSWIQAYQPVLHIGKTILLYNIPETEVGGAAQLISHGDESTK
jgi:hypothetical protein